MIKLSNAIDRVIFNMTVKAMLDPSNEYFYLPRLTLDKVATLCDNDDDKSAMFWQCYHYAWNVLAHKQLMQEIEAGIQTDECSCPECSCKNYIQGVACPNCDYVE